MATDKRVIKKYPNRRLYDTSSSCYITLADVKQLVLDNVDIEVVDAKSGEDLTRSVLLQIILEEESSGAPMFSCDVLTQLIRTYGNAMQGVMGGYLEKNMQFFVDMQKQFAEQAQSVMKGDVPTNPAMWADWMKLQPPPFQDVMGGYLENSSKMFVEMQKKMQEQAQTMFGGFADAGKDQTTKS